MLFCKDLSSHMFLNLLRYNFVGTKIWLIKMINNDTKELNLKLINIFAYVSLVWVTSRMQAAEITKLT